MKNPPKNYVAQRRPQQSETLRPETARWLQELPTSVQPHFLPTEFARIANALHAHWDNPEICLAYFDDLLIDRRGDRRGFPNNVAMEIAILKDYYESEIHPTKQTAWDHIVGMRRSLEDWTDWRGGVH